MKSAQASPAMNALLLQPTVDCRCELQAYVPAAEIYRSSRYRLSNSALAVALRSTVGWARTVRRIGVKLLGCVPLLLVEYCRSTCAALSFEW